MLLPLVLYAAAVSSTDIFNYGAFTQTATYSIANQLGFFAAYDLDVVYHQVPNSTAAYASVLSGEYDLLTGTIDNAVNLRFNSGKNLTVLGQFDQGPDLVLASIPTISNISQLVGKPLIVDSPVSGYAYLLRKILSSSGLASSEYFFQTVGGTNLRYADLISEGLPNGSAVYATIVTYPFTAYGEVLPVHQQPNILARVSSFENPVSSSAFTIAQSALDDYGQSDLLVRFISAMYAANLYLNHPRNRECSTKAIQIQLNITTPTAALEYLAATNLTSGEVSPDKKFTVSQVGLKNIIAVREEFGGFSVPSDFDFVAATAPGPGKLIDYSVRDKAVSGLKRELLSAGC
ncbi:uncharacterized protein LY89DRAFT_784538 [Mollisia scopiformis]|uniref:SsuA/THI5-like domain-containing protein n=1 Tax=Mollisia scopiformis TaxID=149040 RepID=A0A194X0C9_MOLSC|nr:uncharacterized protein LY89DRAFT_784538 [Mollisia scopiformis]KUJ13651.1 hypothetical protein LY89DRAFT_784538 [Mollisia scopiformis]